MNVFLFSCRYRDAYSEILRQKKLEIMPPPVPTPTKPKKAQHRKRRKRRAEDSDEEDQSDEKVNIFVY